MKLKYELLLPSREEEPEETGLATAEEIEEKLKELEWEEHVETANRLETNSPILTLFKDNLEFWIAGAEWKDEIMFLAGVDYVNQTETEFNIQADYLEELFPLCKKFFSLNNEDFLDFLQHEA